MTALSGVLIVTGLLSAGVVYGTDAFFAAVGRPALQQVDEASLTSVMGRLHRYGDARMPVFGVTGILSTTALIFSAGLGTAASGYAILALAGLGVQLGAYLRVAAPINRRQTAATLIGVTPPDARDLQRRWDGVILPRALGCALGVAGLALAALSLR